MKKNTKTEKKTTAADVIAQKFIEKLEAGKIPWIKPWELWKSWSGSTGKDYSGVNVMLLDGGEYLTAKQIKENGGNINKGAKAHQIVHYNEVKKVVSEERAQELVNMGYNVIKDQETGEYINFYKSLKYFNVFSVNEDTTLKTKFDKKVKSHEHRANKTADEIITGYAEAENIELVHGSNSAYANHDNTGITLPQKTQFKTVEGYYSTAFHEMIHTTAGAVKRDKSKYHADDRARAREELVAEIGAAYLMSFLGMDTNKSFENSAAYVQSWAGHLKDDSGAILYAAPKAIEAAEYILKTCGVEIA